MRQLAIYEVGVDPLPVEGATIILLDKTSSWGLFESLNASQEEVRYLGNGEITIEEDVKWDDEEDAFSGTYACVGENPLTEGMLWMYCHEFYLIAGLESTFPFQTREGFDIAVSEGWLQVEGYHYVKGKTKTDAAAEVDAYAGIEEVSVSRKEAMIEYLMLDIEYFRVLLNNKEWCINWQGNPPTYFRYTDKDKEQ